MKAFVDVLAVIGALSLVVAGVLAFLLIRARSSIKGSL